MLNKYLKLTYKLLPIIQFQSVQLEENNFKMEYINNMYQTGHQVEQGYSSKLREVQSIKKELLSDKQKKVQELYRDLGREITKQINK